MEKQRAQFGQGTLTTAYEFLGAHPGEQNGQTGWYFRTWAPHARAVAVTGEFCGWSAQGIALERQDGGIWEGFVAELPAYTAYKFAVTAPSGTVTFKTDPYGFHTETRPANASKLYDLAGYDWGDTLWMRERRQQPLDGRPLNIYEVHLGSWRRYPDGNFLSYRDSAVQLRDYLLELGYNFVELLPVTEHPLDDSWGYQCTGYFAPTSRFGTPHDFMYFVDTLHQAGIGVLLDWVPAHFCKDENGLLNFDGTACYEYGDPRRAEHHSWGTRVFDYGKPEVKSFLLSSAAYWLREYHLDGLRVDAVASMLYLDYDRREGQWLPNRYGGREHLETIDFLRALNETAFAVNPHVLMVAEESTAWPLVTYPPQDGGLGFNLKWNMGWVNDMCHYLKMDPFFRKDNHRDLTFSMMYAFSENFVLPISHDEVVHMKGSLLGKMPGEETLAMAGVRGFVSYMLAHPGKKLLFMGAELGQWHEWDFRQELDWYLLERPQNRQLHRFFCAVNHFYLQESCLWDIDFDWQGFEWLVADDTHNNTVVFARHNRQGETLLCAVNFSPNVLTDYRFGVPSYAQFTEVFSSDAAAFGGSGTENGTRPVEPIPSHGRPQSLTVTLPAMGAVFLRGEGVRMAEAKRQEKREALAL